MPDPTIDRRPIASRQLGPVQAVAAWLVRRKASADAISLIGMGCALVAGPVFAMTPGHPALWLLGAFLVQARLMANLLDGMVALGRGIASPLGELFNEVPDRVSDTAILFGVGLAASRPALGLAAALAAMATAYVRAVGKSAGRPSDFCGPGAKQHRMLVVTVLAVWCFAAPAELSKPAPEIALWLVVALATLTAARRLVRLGRALSR